LGPQYISTSYESTVLHDDTKKLSTTTKKYTSYLGDDSSADGEEEEEAGSKYREGKGKGKREPTSRGTGKGKGKSNTESYEKPSLPSHLSSTLFKFLDLTSRSPHLLRYSNDFLPFSPNPNHPPSTCSHCRSPTIKHEYQLVPRIIHELGMKYSGKDGRGWFGTVGVWSCSTECGGEGWREEWVGIWKED
jgi:hypothetical protein